VAADLRDGPLPAVFLVLTLIAGDVDAICYLQFDHTFVANITGNVLFVGFALAGVSGGSKWTTSLLALAAFFAGAAFTGRIDARFPAGRRGILTAAAGFQLVLVAAALVFVARTPAEMNNLGQYTVVALLALAMGAQSAATRRADVLGVPTVVLTSTLTALAFDSIQGAERNARMRRRIGTIAAMCAGAAIGAACVLRLGTAGALAVALALIVFALALTFRSAVHPPTMRLPS
jgi:uncharacterized membrane protein YoaK (UPF0700 family)